MSPAGLDHADLGVGEEMDGALEEVWLRNEISIENTNELALRGSQTGLERARLKTSPVGPVDQLDVEPATLQFRDARGRQLPGVVGRVVQHLDLEQVFRVIDLAY